MSSKSKAQAYNRKMMDLVSPDFIDVEELTKNHWYVDYMDSDKRKLLIRHTIEAMLKDRLKELKREKNSSSCYIEEHK